MPSVCKFIQLSGINLNDEDDKVVSKLENSGKFTTRSMYRYITFSGMVVVTCEDDGDLEVKGTFKSSDFFVDDLA